MPCMLPIGLLRSGREVYNEDSDDGAKSEEDTADSPPLNPRRGPGLAGLIQEIQRVQPRGAAMTAAQSALLLLNLKETDINAHEISKKKCIRVATLAEYIYQTEKVLMDDAAREFGQRGPRFALAASRFLSTFNYNYPFARRTNDCGIDDPRGGERDGKGAEACTVQCGEQHHPLVFYL